MRYQYTTDEYLMSIRREKVKRDKVYPKIITKMNKAGGDTLVIIQDFGYRRELLECVEYLIQGFGITIYSENTKNDAFQELMREYIIRKRIYPRWIFLDRNRKSPRITQETADYELAVWKELTIYFAETFLGGAQIALEALETKTRKRHDDSR